MAPEGFVSVNEFVSYLKQNGLVLVKQADIQEADMFKRAESLRKKLLSCKEIIDLKLFPKCTSSETIRRWCNEGKFGKDGYLVLENGQYRVHTRAIKKLLYGE